MSRKSYCYSIFEPQRVYPILRLKNYDFSESFVTKIMVSRMLSERSNFHLNWFDKKIVLVRDVKDLMISELLFRPMVAPLQVTAEALTEFLALIKEKEANPQGRSVLELHRRADELGISGMNWEVYRSNLHHLIKVRDAYECAVVHFEDFARGDYSAFRQILSIPIGPANLEGGWVSHIQRKGQSGEWKKWFTPEDMDFSRDFFQEYGATFSYNLADSVEYNTSALDAQYGSEYIEKKYGSRVQQIELLNNMADNINKVEDLSVVASRARDGGLQQIKLLAQLEETGSLPSGVISLDELSKLKFFREVIA